MLAKTRTKRNMLDCYTGLWWKKAQNNASRVLKHSRGNNAILQYIAQNQR